MIERETRKRKENKERQPKKKKTGSKMSTRFAQGKGINTLPPLLRRDVPHYPP